VFNGPYKLSEWTADQRITLVPNTYYAALPPDPKHPRPAKIEFVVVSENPNQLVQDLASQSTYNTLDKAEDFGLTDIAALERSKYQIVVPDALLYEHLELNEATTALKDARVRQALYYGLDKIRYLAALFPGLSAATYNKVALTSPLPSTSPWSNNASLPKNGYNPSKAKALLAAAGYGSGLTLNFVTSTSSSAFAAPSCYSGSGIRSVSAPRFATLPLTATMACSAPTKMAVSYSTAPSMLPSSRSRPIPIPTS